jgi:hypothetical protein
MKLLVSPLVFFGVVSAATLPVPGQYSTIQSAIDAAVDGDTVLVAAGTYEGPIGFNGKNIVVRSAAGPDLTLIRTFLEFFCVYIEEGEDSTAVLEGFRLQNEMSDDHGMNTLLSDNGGGIYIDGASPTIRGNHIDGCHVYEHAGIYVRHSSALIEGNEITGCTNGSGIYALYAGPSGPIRIVGNVISGNNAETGAGIRLQDAWAEVAGNDISWNTSSGAGAGINVTGDSAMINGNYICSNYTTYVGGGMNITSCNNISITNNIISNNHASYSGGGFFEGMIQECIFINNAVLGNSAVNTGGGGIVTKNGVILIENCIVRDNTCPAAGSQVFLLAFADSTSAIIEYSNVQDGADSIYLDSLASLIWGPGNIDADPLFESGPFGDFHLSYGSPCIDAGNPDPQYYDPEDPFNPGYALWPAMGTLRNDMGAFGGGGVGYWLGVEEEASPPVVGEAVLRSFPNPFREGCTICFRLPEGSLVTLEVYDLSGRLVSTLMDGPVTSPGTTAWLDGTGLPSGTYLILLRSGGLTESRRCVLLR